MNKPAPARLLCLLWFAALALLVAVWLFPVSATIVLDLDYFGRNYVNGSAILNGFQSDADLWFREGIIVPEPSTWMLFGVGALVLSPMLGRFVRNRDKR